MTTETTVGPRKGDRFMIYQKPMKAEDPEGMATVVDEPAYCLGYWRGEGCWNVRVRFDSDPESVHRRTVLTKEQS